MIIEDDRGIAEAIEEQARMWGLDTRIAQNFRNIVAEFAEYEPHMILLDISLPFLMDITGVVRFVRYQRCRLFSYLRRQII